MYFKESHIASSTCYIHPAHTTMPFFHFLTEIGLKNEKAKNEYILEKEAIQINSNKDVIVDFLIKTARPALEEY